ncbi:MAG: OsmC family peroxiredoxin [Desulfobacteraceae bacterium]|nr:MAG: OsmC family peroxiredoxin [Desulfobacteraceae bacterium]
MNSQELRAAQMPLKKRYRQDPQAAMLTLQAHGRLNQDRISVRIQTGLGRVEAGLHPATGGDGTLACSGDMLLEALAACAGVTLGAVATAMGIQIRDGLVSVEGDLDFRGTLGVDKEAEVGFKAIRLKFDLDTDADADQMASLMRLTERYCVVHRTLSHPPALSVRCERRNRSAA